MGGSALGEVRRRLASFVDREREERKSHVARVPRRGGHDCHRPEAGRTATGARRRVEPPACLCLGWEDRKSYYPDEVVFKNYPDEVVPAAARGPKWSTCRRGARPPSRRALTVLRSCTARGTVDRSVVPERGDVSFRRGASCCSSSVREIQICGDTLLNSRQILYVS